MTAVSGMARGMVVCLAMVQVTAAMAQAEDGQECYALADTAVLRLDTVGTASQVVVGDTLADHRKRSPYRFRPTQLVAPALLIGTGLVGLGNGWLKHQNNEVREELQENIDKRTSIDDFTQFVPAAATYALNLCGVRGRHGYGGLTVLMATSGVLMGVSVYTLKAVTNVERPDGSARNSFPSGHTAIAFMGAELLRREFWDVSPWIGVAGYAVAAGTGFFRMYNNRHWLTDVIAGAGIGILSVQAAYWLYPVISKSIFGKRSHNVSFAPFAGESGAGLTCGITF